MILDKKEGNAFRIGSIAHCPFMETDFVRLEDSQFLENLLEFND